MTDPDPGGAGGYRAQEHLGRAHMGVLDQGMVLDSPNGVEAHLLGVDRLSDAVVDRLALELGRAELQLGLEDHRELHDSPPRRPPLEEPGLGISRNPRAGPGAGCEHYPVPAEFVLGLSTASRIRSAECGHCVQDEPPATLSGPHRGHGASKIRLICLPGSVKARVDLYPQGIQGHRQLLW